MGGVVKYFGKVIISISFVILLSACVTSENRIFFVVENHTDKKITVRNIFISEADESRVIEFNLLPGEDSWWHFEPSYLDKDVIDKNLDEIVIFYSSECNVLLNRKRIEDLSKLDEWWVLKVDDNVMNSGQQPCSD